MFAGCFYPLAAWAGLSGDVMNKKCSNPAHKTTRCTHKTALSVKKMTKASYIITFLLTSHSGRDNSLFFPKKETDCENKKL